MSKLIWDATGERRWETGTDHGVLYVMGSNGNYGNGVAWNGLTAVNENPSGAEANDLWADNIKYATLRSAENFGATIEAYTYPDEFMACDGSADLVPGVTVAQQGRASFGFSYRTKVGSDTDTDASKAYKIHLVYGASASPSDRSYQTVNESPDAITFSWEISTIPVAVTNMKPTAHIIVDSSKFVTNNGQAALAAFEDYLYGDNSNSAQFPLPNKVKELLTFTD